MLGNRAVDEVIGFCWRRFPIPGPSLCGVPAELTYSLGCGSQGDALGWYALPRWGKWDDGVCDHATMPQPPSHPADIPAGHTGRDGRDCRDCHTGRGFLSGQHAGNDVGPGGAEVAFSHGAHFGRGQRFHLSHQPVVVVISDAVKLVEGRRPRQAFG